MANTIRVNDQLFVDALSAGERCNRSPGQQIEHWARIGKMAEENPDLSYKFIAEIQTGLAEHAAGRVFEFKFGP